MIRRKHLFAGIGALFLIFLAVFVYQFVSAGLRYGNAANAEYPTFGVINDVLTYVENNEGEWPTSWQALGMTDELSDRVHIRFDLTSEQIIADPNLIHEAIRPATGPWRVHPDGELALEQLRERITDLKQQSVKK